MHHDKEVTINIFVAEGRGFLQDCDDDGETHAGNVC
jgi:hypothetical protein